MAERSTFLERCRTRNTSSSSACRKDGIKGGERLGEGVEGNQREEGKDDGRPRQPVRRHPRCGGLHAGAEDRGGIVRGCVAGEAPVAWAGGGGKGDRQEAAE